MLSRWHIVLPRYLLLIGVAAAVIVGASGLFAILPQAAPAHPAGTGAEHREENAPPWIYGRVDARFTIVEYADLQCEYCRAYFPILRQWIDQNPQVKWQWHHLPLGAHDPAATQAARLAECAGETAGNTAFWTAIDWLYANPQDVNGSLVPPREFPGSSPALSDCIKSQKPDAAIRTLAQAAAAEGITATPTLRLLDNDSGRSLLLSGTVEGDALLSALDLLVAPAQADRSGADEDSKPASSMVSDAGQ